MSRLLYWLLMSWGLQQPALLTHITWLVWTQYRIACLHEGIDLTSPFTVFLIVIQGCSQPNLWLQHAWILVALFTWTRFTVPLIQWKLNVIHAMPAPPRYRYLLQNTRGNCALFFLFGSYLAVTAPASGHSAVTKGFQLCYVRPAALCTPAHRGVTVITPETL